MTRALIVVRHPDGMQLFVNDTQVAMEVVKAFSPQALATMSPKSPAHSKASSACRTSASMESSPSKTSSGSSDDVAPSSLMPTFTREQLLSKRSPPGIPVKNTFTHYDDDGTGDSSDSGCFSAPAVLHSLTTPNAASLYDISDTVAMAVQTDADGINNIGDDGIKSVSGTPATPTCHGVVDAGVQTSFDLGCIDASTQTRQVDEDHERLQLLHGSWETAHTVNLNDVVQVRQEFLSAVEAPVNLAYGMRGLVKSIDKDGDISVYFPILAKKGVYGNVFVFAHDFAKLSRLKV